MVQQVPASAPKVQAMQAMRPQLLLSLVLPIGLQVLFLPGCCAPV